MPNTYEHGPQLIYVTFTGLSGNGNVTISGLEVGDVVLNVWLSGNNYASLSNSYFYGWVYTAGELVQTANVDLSGNTYEALLVRF
jgi:hypothetical protein